ncbi:MULTISPECIES: aspartate/glutamate racemase family protein [Brevibacillus]|jgi:allantoin racemase|uniref:aspartate/glutamate racemase family protein n=1 Tax=Brevibacillus TaxID=55080 RepID=UPI0015622318|nr:aspartate/glutamate racemase family protein [Brevibacillus borstelensis]MBE5397672.1 hydantoin racemase [Brevibacillus borstelensis]MCC0563671.1 aspartate/glutamate racemase family protein [Brevibacillus borstelensis]MCM3469316.1 aspartate/glutamate racemase family protein [Brevibacillus borstelensis]MCM3558736.1 aspartate/glutamate racemase family protein [Brevibacillus borstelensis]MCM3591962.1 aspartate/glutamate racemase family protein [Brevibacillus borstelensis]
MIGIIRVITTDDADILNEHGKLIESKYGVQTVSACIPDQPYGICDEVTERQAVPKIVALGQRLAASGCRVLVISCADDPGIDALRQQVRVPVIGAGSAAALLAKGYGEPVGLLDIAAEPPRVMKRILGRQLAWHISPPGVTNSAEVMAPHGREAALNAVRTMVENGAKTIAFACTGYSTIGLAPLIRREFGVTVIDPVEAEGLLAWYIVKNS